MCVGGALKRPVVSCPREGGQRCIKASIWWCALLSLGGRGAAVWEGATKHSFIPNSAAWSSSPPAWGCNPSEVAYCGKEE